MVGHWSLFSQVLLLVNRHQFARRVKECCAEKAAKGFSCWSQFVAMMFCQMAQAKSLREISDGLAQVSQFLTKNEEVKDFGPEWEAFTTREVQIGRVGQPTEFSAGARLWHSRG